MADALTTTYKFTQPEVGSSDNTWGDKLNANWAKLDSFFTSSGVDETGFIGGSTSALGYTFRIAGPTATLQLYESDLTAPAGQYRHVVNGDIYYFQRALTADFGTANTIWSYANSGNSFLIEANLTLQGTVAALTFAETDQADPAGRYRLYANGGLFYLLRSTGADWASSAVIWSYDPAKLTTMFESQINVENTGPMLYLTETDQTNPAGRYRHAVSGDVYFFQRALTANFATSTNIWSYSGSTGLFTLTSALDAVAATFNAVVEVKSTVAELRFTESDQSAPAGMFRLVGTGNTFLMQKSTSSTWATQTTVWGVDATPNFYTTLRTQLAITHGTVEVGSTTAAVIAYQRTGGVNHIVVPDAASLRVQNVTGTAWATISSASGWVAGTSDIRLKDNVEDIHYGLDTVMALRAVQFDRKADGVHDLGLVSQEVQRIVPEVIEEAPGEDGEAYLFLRKDGLVPVLIKAVQELAARVEILEGA